MTRPQATLVLAYGCAAHAIFHVVTALFLTLVLLLETEWRIGYSELIALWTAGAVMLGAGAPVAGWLGDRLGEVRVMIANLLGTGAAAILCGLADGPTALWAGLTLMGVFGAVYHPVGTAWVIKNVERRGRSIAILGISGSIGVALSSLVAAAIAWAGGWRAAFIWPGIVSIAVGLLLLVHYTTGRIRDRSEDLAPVAAPAGGAMARALVVLVAAMALTSVAYHAFTTMLPKWIQRDAGLSLGDGLIGIGSVVALIYLVGALAQIVGGHFSDRGYTREVYVASFVLKLIALVAATVVTGWPIVLVAIVVAFVFDVAAPVESVLIARYTPSGRRGLAFGIRNGIAILAAPAGIQLVAQLFGETTGFQRVLTALAVLAAITLAVALLLPGDTRSGARKETAGTGAG